MKEKFRKIIGSCMFVVCLTAVLLFTAVPTEASDTTDEGVTLVTIEDYTSDKLQTEIGKQLEEGYLYAGLYKSGTTTVADLVARNVVVKDKITENNTYVAKFVPKGVMGIRAQVSSSLLSNPNAENSSVRFVTAIDSLLYKEVGFSITRIGDNGEQMELVVPENVTKYVYEELYGVDVTSANPGEPMEYTPKDIHALAEYFKTYTITNVPAKAYNTDLTVTPYWVTHDGVKVEGTMGIKSVNFGRSWVYVNESANANDSLEFGTYNHPFTNLADAIDAIVLDNDGKIIIQNNCSISVANDFTWAQRGKDFTITGEGTGEDNTESLDFSQIATAGIIDINDITTESPMLNIGDGVTFTNLNLTLTDIVFANGNRLKVEEDVTVSNPVTYLFGGSQGASSTELASVASTDVTLLSGTYKHIYGGGYNCKVTGSTKVHVGGSANTDGTISFRDHSSDYTVYGGSHVGVVSKNTTVNIDENVRFNYIYGGGHTSGSSISGTTYVTFKGKAMSVYGGSHKTVVNNGTNVVMDSANAEVDQIFGGCCSSKMSGNTNVQVLEGTVYRRVYGGCYNNYSSFSWDSSHGVTGYASVAFGPSEDVTLKQDYDNDSYGIEDSTYYAVSRHNSNYEGETGVLIVNDYDVESNSNRGIVGTTDFISSSVKPYHYLVQASENGEVRAAGERIHVIPDDGYVATVRKDDGTVLAYITSEGFCELPELDATTGQKTVYVEFTSEKPEDVNVEGYEAKVGGTYFATLEDAIAEAKVLSASGKIGTDNPIVTLLKDVSIDSELVIDAKSNITVQSEGENKYTITGNDSTKNLFKVNGTFTMNKIKLTGGNDGINVYENTLRATDVEISNSGRNALFANGGNIVLSNVKVTGTTKQALLFQNKAIAFVSDFNVEGTSSQVAVRVLGGADVTLNDGTISANNGFGIYINEDSSKVKATDTRIIRATGKNALVGVDNATAQLIFNQSETGEAYIDGNSLDGRGVEVTGTFILNGGTIRSNKADTGAGVMVKDGATFTMTGGEISNNTATSTTSGGGGVYVASNATFNMNAPKIEGATPGVITGNVASKYGAGVLVLGTFNMNAGNISSHGSESTPLAVEGTGVCLSGTSATFTMNGGEITNNYSSKAGAAVLMTNGDKDYPIFNMYGGSITNNTTSANGGGVALANGVFTMHEGSTISQNEAQNGGGMTMSGGTADTKPSFVMNGGKISNNDANAGKDINFSGTATIKLAQPLTENMYLKSNTYAVTRQIAVKDGDITDEQFADSMKYIMVDPSEGTEWCVADTGYLAKTGAILQSGGRSVHYATLESAIDAAIDGSTIEICDNATITKTIDKALTFTSDKAVTVTADASLDGTMFIVDEGKTLNITGATAEQKISIIGVSSKNVIGSSGNLVLENVSIAGGNKGIYVETGTGTTTLTGVDISDCASVGLHVATGTNIDATDIHVSDINSQGILIQSTDAEEGITRKISNFTVANTKSAAVKVESGANVTFENGTISVTTYGIAVADEGSYAILNDVKVERQHFENAKANTSNELINIAAGSVLELNETTDSTTIIDGNNEVKGLVTSGNVILNGGKFENCVGSDITFKADDVVIKLSKALTSNIKVTPKIYAVTTRIAEPNNILDEDFQNSIGYITVQPNDTEEWFVNSEGYLTKTVAILDPNGAGVHYAVLEDAIDAAANGSAIKICADATITKTIDKALTFTSDKAVTVTADDSLASHMFDVTSGTLTITGASETEKISLVAGRQTQSVIHNKGGESVLTNVEMTGNTNSTVADNAGRGIFNEAGTVTANSVTIQNMKKGDGVYIKAGTILNLDNVKINDVNRYGIKCYGTVNIYNTINKAHALSIENTNDHGIDIDNAGEVKTALTEVPDNTYVIKIQTTKKSSSIGILVRAGGSVDISSLSVKDTKKQGVYFYGTSATKTASGSISDFEVGGTGDAAIDLAYSTATLTNGTITSGTYCIKTDANSTLTTSEVKVTATGTNAALSILGTKLGDDIIIME